MEFSAWKGSGFGAFKTDIIFILALVAFGLKAGFIPFHVWLPLAHPAAPSHVSALMSGIMIKMGIYGILRILTFITPFHQWWGGLLIGIGALSGVLGVLFAIGQHDIKRLLAYSSVENIGIIFLGIGLGIIGMTFGADTVAVFGFAGGLLHIVNHAFFKSLLFLGAGAVIRQAGTGTLDRLGGLIKSMPHSAFLFLIGSAAICGLPFLNGFISEIMIYAGSIHGAVHPSQPVLSMLCLTVIISLALIGGLAIACFTKVFGIVFLGGPRSASVQITGEVPLRMRGGMWILAVLCVFIGMASPLTVPFIIRTVALFTGPSVVVNSSSLISFTDTVSVLFASIALIIVIIAGFKRMLVRKNRSTTKTVTWDCGYSAPGPSMQYTASSFTAPLLHYFKKSLAARQELKRNGTYFPGENWSFNSSVDDWFLSRVFTPVIILFDHLFLILRWFQNGKSGQYVLYIALTALCLVLWKFFL
jgi:formate hydrogenlyase subunit 3/multisubunit Na+/H+ antiporter MnhD subunit